MNDFKDQGFFLGKRFPGSFAKDASQAGWRDLFDIRGNVDSLERAKITYLCETHTKLREMLSIGHYLRINAKPGDVVYLEGTQSGQPVDIRNNQFLQGVQEGVKVIGWDDMKAFEEGERLYDQLDRLNSEIESDKVQEVEKMILRIQRSDLLRKIHDIAIVRRNKSLIDTLSPIMRVEEEESTDRRFFVVLGQNHIEKDESVTVFSKEIPHAVLIPK